MQTSYSINPARAVEGMVVGDRESIPRLLPLSAQVTTLTVADPQAGANVLSATDVGSGVVHQLEFTSTNATDTTVDAIVAAAAINGEFRNLFSVVDTSATVATATAKHGGREYTFSLTTAFGTTTVTPADTVEHDAIPGLNMGRMVRRGAGDGEISALSADTVLSQLEGIVFRTDGSHFHKLVETPSDEDILDAGKYLAVMQKGRLHVQVEDSVTPASSVYVRRAQTLGAGAVGRFRGSIAGSAQISTITPVAGHVLYSIEFGYNGLDYTFEWAPSTGGLATVDDAVDGLEDSAAAIVPAGVTASAASGVTMTLTAVAGSEFDYVRSVAFSLDVEAASAVVSTAAADVDVIDVSSICSFETSASAGGLALLRIHA